MIFSLFRPVRTLSSPDGCLALSFSSFVLSPMPIFESLVLIVKLLRKSGHPRQRPPQGQLVGVKPSPSQVVVPLQAVRQRRGTCRHPHRRGRIAPSSFSTTIITTFIPQKGCHPFDINHYTGRPSHKSQFKLYPFIYILICHSFRNYLLIDAAKMVQNVQDNIQVFNFFYSLIFIISFFLC